MNDNQSRGERSHDLVAGGFLRPSEELLVINRFRSSVGLPQDVGRAGRCPLGFCFLPMMMGRVVVG